MQYQPSAEDLLAAIAELLDDKLLPALPDALRHECRVAANLARILERQERLGPDAAAREPRAAAGAARREDKGAVALAARLTSRIRADDDPEFQRQAWDALVAIARDDLAIAKPEHDAWEGI